LERGANIEARDKDGNTALTRAREYERKEIFQALLDRGANIYAMDKDGKNSLYYSLSHNHLQVQQWQAAYVDLVKKQTPPKSKEDVYHLLAVIPLDDPHAEVDRVSHISKIISSAKWPPPKVVGGVVKHPAAKILADLAADHTISNEQAEDIFRNCIEPPPMSRVAANHQQQGQPGWGASR
jgi:hypothetical protein